MDSTSVPSSHAAGASDSPSPGLAPSPIPLRKTGNAAFDQELTEVAEYFECSLEGDGGGDINNNHIARIKLPIFTPGGRSYEQCQLRVVSTFHPLTSRTTPTAPSATLLTETSAAASDSLERPADCAPRPNRDYSLEFFFDTSPSLPADLDQAKWDFFLENVHEESQALLRRNMRSTGRGSKDVMGTGATSVSSSSSGSILSSSLSFQQQHRSSAQSFRSGAKIITFIDCLYCSLEHLFYPGKDIIVRDYCYSIYDPRHWGRPFPGQLEKLVRLATNRGGSKVYKARAKFDFDAGGEGEMSIKENEILYILANLGNGWLSARRPSPTAAAAVDSSTGSESVAAHTATTNSSTIAPQHQEANIGFIPENYVKRL